MKWISCTELDNKAEQQAESQAGALCVMDVVLSRLEISESFPLSWRKNL